MLNFYTNISLNKYIRQLVFACVNPMSLSASKINDSELVAVAADLSPFGKFYTCTGIVETNIAHVFPHLSLRRITSPSTISYSYPALKP